MCFFQYSGKFQNKKRYIVREQRVGYWNTNVQSDITIFDRQRAQRRVQIGTLAYKITKCAIGAKCFPFEVSVISKPFHIP